MKDPKGKAYPAELKDKYKLCPECNNKDDQGYAVLGHAKGSLQCWKIRKGLLKAHPMFKKHASTYPNLKSYDPPKKGASKGRPALIHSVDSIDACCPILMVNDMMRIRTQVLRLDCLFLDMVRINWRFHRHYL